MLINPEEINKILAITGSDVTNRGKKYFEQGRVKIKDFVKIGEDDFNTKTIVEGTYLYNVDISRINGKISYGCNCPIAEKRPTPCKHVIATLFDLYINSDSYLKFSVKNEKKDIELLEDIVKTNKQIYSTDIIGENNKMISYYENLEYGLDSKYNGEIKLIPRLQVVGFRDKDLQVTFKIGVDKLYILKDIYEFTNNILNQDVVKYGKELEFKHTFNKFTPKSKLLAQFLCNIGSKYLAFNSQITYSSSMNKELKKSINLEYSTLDEFFDAMKDRKISIDGYEYEEANGVIQFVEEDPALDFEVIENEGLGLNILNTSKGYKMYKGQETIYILYKDKFHKCSLEYAEKMLPLLEEFQAKRNNCIKIEDRNATSFCEYLLPAISKKSKVNIDDKILQKHKADKLGTKVYLDIDDKSNIIAKVLFCYNDYKFNPFDLKVIPTCNRNIIAETKVKTLLKNYNFLVNANEGYIHIDNEDHIYEFLTNGINIFMEKFEVLVTDKLKNRKIINNKTINMGVRINNNLIEINIDDLGLSESELKEIFNRYKLKKKYFRLKDGSFLNLEGAGIDTLINMSQSFDISEKEFSKGEIKLQKYRAIYLENLLKDNKQITVEKDGNFKQLVRDVKESSDANFQIPKDFDNVLREYQKTGFYWLKTLEKYGFGGILADDMGLGKTIQIIALLDEERQINKGKSTSIVVCPSSLYINWEKEISKFAPNMKILIVAGNAKDRENYIKNVAKYDVVLTSYDLLKRDIEFYEKCNFKYAIADEAQYIKNNNTKNAKALKKLNAQTRFALTGTPIENSLSELWSIFDFVMPGYLFSYQRFKENYETPIVKDEDKYTLSNLQKLVAPFVLRRIKKEVLKELPDKTETVMYSKMDEEQEVLYKSFLAKAQKEMQAEMENVGFEKSRIKILALITRLRQICCHPSLFVENYNGQSAKLDQCIEIVKDAIAAGHKILLFSGFTSMFELISNKLEENNIEFFTLTGNTKVDTRVQMVEDFNKSENVKVFLISLKAGGTGLNLVGADMVIHYDPWWNISAQNQATDRAYRIGQRSNVQVFKLITQNSIEEKILNLQNKKMDLTNSVITEKETFISKMSKEEIMDLFNL